MGKSKAAKLILSEAKMHSNTDAEGEQNTAYQHDSLRKRLRGRAKKNKRSLFRREKKNLMYLEKGKG